MTLEKSLDHIFRNVIDLIYRNKCIWHDTKFEDVECSGSLDITYLIQKNAYYRWDFNNAVLMCKKHNEFYKGNLEGYSISDAQSLLLDTHPHLVNFVIDNIKTPHKELPDRNLIKNFLVKHQIEAIGNNMQRFPSLYGKFEV